MNSYKNAILSLFLIIFSVSYIFYQLQPQEVSLSVEDETVFSVNRASSHIEAISKSPHYTGASNHASVRNYLVDELEKLGLEVHTQKDFSINSLGQISIPENIIAKLPANQQKITSDKNTGDLLLLSHYDSAPHASYGAADAASGVATILESLRSFIASEETFTNDIIICFTDAEEIGLLGAKLFVDKHPFAQNVGLTLNFEARGTAGPSNMIIETNQGNEAIISTFKSAQIKHPLANSLIYSVYKMLPNNTDSTVFREELDVPGMFFAFIDNHYNYHTANDRLDKLDKRSLAHQGDYLLPLLKVYGNTDLSKLKSSNDNVYFNIPLIGVIDYPASWSIFFFIVAALVFALSVLISLKKRVLSYREILLGLIVFWGLLLFNALIAFFGWKLITFFYPSYLEILQGFTYNSHNYIVVFAALSLANCLIFQHLFRFKIQIKNAFVGPLFTWMLINLLVLIYLPGASYIILPFLFALVIFVLLLFIRLPNSTIMLILSLPLLFLTVPLVQFFPVGLGMNYVFISAILITLIYGLIMPIINHYPFNNALAYISFCLALGFFVVAHVKSPFTSDFPQPTSLVYLFDEEKNQAFWASYDNLLTNWNEKYFDDQQDSSLNETNFLSKYQTKFSKISSAPIVELQKSLVEIEKFNDDNTDFQKIRISPKQNTNRIDVYLDPDVDFETIKINQQSISKENDPNHQFFGRASSHLLTYYVVDSETLEIVFSTKELDEIKLTVLESSFNLLENKELEVSKRPRNQIPKPFVINDAIIYKHNIIIQ
ncbi:MAG: M28 family peptidase [Bacteroidota bacterium]